MSEYRHHVSGFFVEREKADITVSRLVAQGIPRERLHLFDADSAPPAREHDTDSKKVLKDVLVDGAIGTAVGTGIGALAQLGLVAANVSLFVASPLIGPLAMLGWGASLGGLVGAAAGAEKRDVSFSALVRDAVASGQVVLVAETRSEQETAIATDIVQAALREYDVAGGK
jgi:hypothetical protein